EVVYKPFRSLEIIDKRVRRDHPTEPESGRQRLRDCAEGDDVFGWQPLQRPHRLTVIAKLGVVVIFDEQRFAALGPPEKRAAALAAQDATGWELVGWREEECVGLQPVDHDTFGVDWLRSQLDSQGTNPLVLRRMRGILDRDAHRSACLEASQQQI